MVYTEHEMHLSGCKSIRITDFSARREDMKHMTESNIQGTDQRVLQPNTSNSVEAIQALNCSVKCFTITAQPFSSIVSPFHKEI